MDIPLLWEIKLLNNKQFKSDQAISDIANRLTDEKFGESL